MSEQRYFLKTAKLDRGILGKALAVASSDGKLPTILAGILTIGDVYSNRIVANDQSEKIQRVLSQLARYQVVIKVKKTIPDERNEIKETLRNWCDNLDLSLVLTYGGTGLQPRHVTPEATKSVVDKEVPGISTAILNALVRENFNSMLARGVCGIRNDVLVVNLPDAPQFITAALKVILPALPFAVDQLKNDQKLIDTVLSEARNDNTGTITPNSTGVIDQSYNQSVVAQAQQPSQPATPQHQSTPVIPHHAAPSISHHAEPVIAHHTAPVIAHHTAPSIAHHAAPVIAHHAAPVVAHHAEPAEPAAHHAPDESEGLSEGTFPSSLITEEDLKMFDIENGLTQPPDYVRVVGQEPITGSDSGISGSVSTLGTLTPTDFGKVARRNRSYAYPAVGFDKAFSLILSRTTPLPACSLSCKDAIDHYLWEDVLAQEDVPSTSTAINDGYAVIASNLPGDLDIVPPGSYLTVGRAVRVGTGDPLPPGSDAVALVEQSQIVREENQGAVEAVVRFFDPVTPGQHLRAVGSDTRAGEVIVRAGIKLGYAECSVLTNFGLSSVRVNRLPAVAVISTGAEIVEPNNYQPGKVRDSNRLALSLALQKLGHKVVDMGIVTNEVMQLKNVLIQAYNKADVVITTGGVSLGANDYVKPLLSDIGVDWHFKRVEMKPGAPTGFATLETQRGKKYFFALPGVPVPALMAFQLLVLPCLRKLSGSKSPRSTLLKAKISKDVFLGNVPDFQRGKLRHELGQEIPWVDVTGGQIISRLISMVDADVLVLVPPKSGGCDVIKNGETVDVLVMSPA